MHLDSCLHACVSVWYHRFTCSISTTDSHATPPTALRALCACVRIFIFVKSPRTESPPKLSALAYTIAY